ncbi:MAG: hypothetical protein KJO55_09585 [Gammaproteobacteria bacterium]|nr:hypothetical protein [Gammaproteobacteria bacterium]NND59266.1 hypothetical protein [Gammaproteobacteria bacterium]
MIQLMFAVIIVLGILGAMAIQHYSKQQRYTRSELQGFESEFRERLQRLESLEERVAVLEKIVTDKRYDLDEQLRNLDKTG